jgi:hypothetical protein
MCSAYGTSWKPEEAPASPLTSEALRKAVPRTHPLLRSATGLATFLEASWQEPQLKVALVLHHLRKSLRNLRDYRLIWPRAHRQD